MKYLTLLMSLFILSSCGESLEDKVQRDVVIAMARRLERVEKKLHIRVPPEEKFWFFESEGALKEAVKNGALRKK